MITNKEDKCTPIASLVKNENGDALDGGLENLISINSDGNVEVNEASYDGTELTFKLMIEDPSGRKVFKNIRITDLCVEKIDS